MNFWDFDLSVLLELGRHSCGAPSSRPGVRELLVRSLLRIRDKHGRLLPLVPNLAQRQFAARATGRDIILKARQLGITTWVAARFFVATITRPGTLTVQVAHDQSSAEGIFRIVHRFLENLPERLRRGALVTSRDNIRQIVFPRLDSEYRVETAADPDAGRGLTIRNLHCSEVARWPGDAAATLASLRAAVPADGDIILESTPNGAAGCFYDEWQRAPETGYGRHFFPWWLADEYAFEADGQSPMADGKTATSVIVGEHVPGGEGSSTSVIVGEHAPDGEGSSTSVILSEDARENQSAPLLGARVRASESKDLVFADSRPPRADGPGLADDRRPTTGDDLSPEERALVQTHGLTLAQIAFRRHIHAGFRKFARQEYAEDPVSCFLASGECFFDLEPLERRLGALAPPLETNDNGRLLTWYPPQPGAAYIIGVDPAGGGSEGDYGCAQVIDRLTGMQCAELHGHFTPRELAPRIAALGHAYHDALLAIERNNHGHAVIVHLEEVLGYRHLYREHNQTGFLTTAVTRPRALEIFACALAHTPELFCSERLLNECRSFVRQPDGSSAAAAGAHDDCVLAMAIAQYVRLDHAGRAPSSVEFASFAR